MMQMAGEMLQIVRGTFSMEDPWALPPSCAIVRLRRSTDASAPRLATTVCPWYDSEYLNVVFSAADDYILATMTDRDAPIYNEDVVEVFVAPERRDTYFEIEVSPRGTLLDARIDSPDGVRSSMKVDFDWKCEGLLSAVRKVTEGDGSMTVDTLIRIPFRALGVPEAPAGGTWLGNFFRIDRHPTVGDEYSSWRPTMQDPPDFHVPAAFGSLKFLK
jgi:hypothetical protein